jgi:hypothetical protein
MTLDYRMPPGDTGALHAALHPLDHTAASWSGTLPRQDDWAERFVEVDLAPGQYHLSFEVERTWSNPHGTDATAPPESRTLGFALSSLTFAPGGSRSS